MSSTRERILDAATELVEAEPAKVPSMSEVARATGISRQALYLHFPDRAALLLALVEHVDAREDLAGAIAKVAAAGDGAAQVRAWVEMQASRNPRIAALARALDQSRHEDDSTTVAWRDRTANRMRAATAIVQRLRREGGRAPQLDHRGVGDGPVGARVVPGVGRRRERGGHGAGAVRRDRHDRGTGDPRHAGPARAAPRLTLPSVCAVKKKPKRR